MRKGQPVVVNGRTYASLTKAAENEGVVPSTAHCRALKYTENPSDGSEWDLSGRRLYSDKVRKSTVMVVYRGRMFHTYKDAGEWFGLHSTTIRAHVLDGKKNCYLLDSDGWYRIDPGTGERIVRR